MKTLRGGNILRKGKVTEKKGDCPFLFRYGEIFSRAPRKKEGKSPPFRSKEKEAQRRGKGWGKTSRGGGRGGLLDGPKGDLLGRDPSSRVGKEGRYYLEKLSTNMVKEVFLSIVNEFAQKGSVGEAYSVRVPV